MPDWGALTTRLRSQAAQAPRLLWAAGGTVVLAGGLLSWLEFSAPPYTVLEDGLSPQQGGKVITALQKLGIPYQLQAAGEQILVPAPDLAQARLQLGAAQVPGDDATNAWSQVENAPMTASDGAQAAMANQALELSLQQSIEGLQGISAAQVFLAVPAQTAFLADQPKPSASVVINAENGDAAAQAPAIAALVAGAVPGLSPDQVTVATNAGVTVYPQTGAAGTQAQLATTAEFEAEAAARVAEIMTPLVGPANFRAGVTADLDFTATHTHQVSYGPGHVMAHDITDTSHQTGNPQQPALGIPGALSNQPPAVTTAAPPTPATGATATPKPSTQPQQDSNNDDSTYDNDESDSDITRPAWAVKGLAVSVVVNQAALGALTPGQLKTAIGAAFSYPGVTVNVLAAPFKATAGGPGLLASLDGDTTHSLLELLAAAFVLFGLALPLSRRLASVDLRAILTPPPAPVPVPVMPTLRADLNAPPAQLMPLREQIAESPRGVASLLQGWADETEEGAR